jgi:hypothetical protein
MAPADSPLLVAFVLLQVTLRLRLLLRLHLNQVLRNRQSPSDGGAIPGQYRFGCVQYSTSFIKMHRLSDVFIIT